MTKHQSRVYLPLAISRCARLQDCFKASTCARNLVAHEIGRPTEDMTRTHGWTAVDGCAHRIEASQHRKPASAGPAPAKEYVKGLL